MSAVVLPQVSLISSWYVPPRQLWTVSEPELPALKHALHQQVAFHDLYFLHPADMAWYLNAAGREVGEKTISPLEFASSLQSGEIAKIADELTKYLTGNYHGRLVGPRPRFTALATYWPKICLSVDESQRTKSVCAVRHSLYLAQKLGCSRVEIVGGSALPDKDEKITSPEKAYKVRMQTLVRSLIEVFTGKEAEELFGPPPWAHVPRLCVEIEPGGSFLMKDVSAFVDLHNQLKEASPEVAQQVLLNVDIAHMMLTEVPERERQKRPKLTGPQWQLEVIERARLDNWVGHMHISDHTRAHASDLTPGTYHFYHDYGPWLKLAIRLANDPDSRFSGAVAVEMEACADIYEAARAIGRVRRWLRHAAEDIHFPPTGPVGQARLSEGAIVVFDIGNSTERLTAKGDLYEGAHLLEVLVDRLCRRIHSQRGATWSFTGDGLIAHFDVDHFLGNHGATAVAAYETCKALANETQSFITSQPNVDLKGALSIRFGLHWGSIYVPTAGTLRFEAFGKDVVIACRSCDFVSKILEPALPRAEQEKKCQGAATQSFKIKLDSASATDGLTLWGEQLLKGVGMQTLHTCMFNME